MLDIGIQLTLTDNLDVRASLQNCNDWQDKFFSGRTSDNEATKNTCQNDTGFAFSVAAQVREQPGEMVETKSLPACSTDN